MGAIGGPQIDNADRLKRGALLAAKDQAGTVRPALNKHRRTRKTDARLSDGRLTPHLTGQ